SNRKYYGKISRRFKELEKILRSYDSVKDLEKDINGDKEIIATSNKEELRQLAEMEMEELQ
ncbi:MAG TPA: peptide chain release factor 1, partial [Candidatus Cloacimonas sp.]|nr:peptide chain release factor 1 [Candidatus Cloacimonas sp.]